MTQPPSTWQWTAQREAAAKLVADDAQSEQAIADTLGIGRQTLIRWKHHPLFAERVAGLVEAYRTAVKRRGIAERQNRVDALNERWQKMQAVIEARAAAIDPDDMSKDPLGFKSQSYTQAALASGFATGLVAVEWVSSPKSGFRPQFKVDTGLLSEMRNTEKQAAQELGQWDDGSSNTTTVVIKQIIGIDRDAL